MNPSLTRASGLFLLANLAVFAGYRLAFLAAFADPFPLRTAPRILLSGARIDVALLGVELALVLVVHVFVTRGRLVSLGAALWGLTGAHLMFACVNVVFYAQRNQHVGEQFMAFVLDPREMGFAVGPFVQHNLFLTLGVVAAGGAYAWTARRACRTDAERPWPPRRERLRGFALAALACLFFIHPVRVKYQHSPLGWGVDLVLAKHLMSFGSYTQNQAVANPLYELLFDLVPAALTSSVTYTQTEDEALAACTRLLGLAPEAATSPYPLWRESPARFDLGIRNVVIIQVEGLTESLVTHEVDGVPVMPYLRSLEGRGISFPNAFQSFNDTVGSVFATASSYHKACFEEQTRRLTTYELHGSFASMPRVFPKEYEHFFYEGFRQSAADFRGYMGNQGYTSMCYEDIAERVAGRGDPRLIEGDLGIYDGPVMDLLAETLIARGDRPFTAHLMTGTSHSPWQTPPGFPTRFAEQAFNAFAYFDACLESFLTRLEAEPGFIDRTLFVIVADHTSVTLTDDLAERLRVPLVFLHPRLDTPEVRAARATRASHVDILPTILDVMGLTVRQAGFGRSLFDPSAPSRGVISGSRGRGYYIDGDFVLQVTPRAQSAEVFAFDGRHIDHRDVSAEHPALADTMFRDYLAQYELARRLAVSKRVCPPN